MNVLRKITDQLNRFRAWLHSRKVRKVRRATGAVVDTAAAGTGFVLRLGVKIVLTIFLVFITTGLLLVCIFSMYVKTCLTEEQLNLTMEEMTTSLSSHILVESSPGSNDWQEVATLYADENRIWADYEEIPQYLEYAAVAIEDSRFYTHKGVDWFRTVYAFGNMFLGMRDTFGGSTITQQLIKNLTGKDDATVQRKLLEIFQALEFEKQYTKQEIITMYLNEIYLGERCYGVRAAAREYFDKELSELTLAECAGLIGITNNPSLYDPYLGENSRERYLNRRNTILFEMYDQGYISYEEYRTAADEELHLQRAEGEERVDAPNSYYIDSLIYDVVDDLAEVRNISEDAAWRLLYNGGYNVYACMDPDIQSIVDSVYQNVSNLPQPYRSSSQQLNSAIVIMDPYTGDIVALAGGTGAKTSSFTNNYATELRRPPGSSFKPVAVYGPALDLGLITADEQFNDTANLTLNGISNWYPRNSGNVYSGWITVRYAVMMSRNTIAAQVLDRLGLQSSWDYLTNHFGFTSLVRDYLDPNTGQVVTDYAYAPLALGQLSYGVTVLEMAQAYTAFVNDGVMSYGRTYSLVTDSDGNVILDNPTQHVVSLKANTARTMTSILHDTVTDGLGSAANFSSTAVAGKTGTTSDDKDRYFVGYTRYYTCAVWTGYDTPETMYFYSNPAAQIFRTVMSQIHAGLEYWSFETPSAGTAANIFTEATSTPSPTDTPQPTDTPTPSATADQPQHEAPPAFTEPEPVATEVPAATDPPAAAETPAATEIPAATDPPAATEPPQEPDVPPLG